jgi:hypothetical protein
VERGKVLVDCFSCNIKDFFLGNLVALFAREKRKFAKAVDYANEVDLEAFLEVIAIMDFRHV